MNGFSISITRLIQALTIDRKLNDLALARLSEDRPARQSPYITPDVPLMVGTSCIHCATETVLVPAGHPGVCERCFETLR